MSESLERKYAASDSAVLEIVHKCAAAFSSGALSYVCHHWTEAEYAAIQSGQRAEAPMCEGVAGQVYTRGENQRYPGCEQCWCCARK